HRTEREEERSTLVTAPTCSSSSRGSRGTLPQLRAWLQARSSAAATCRREARSLCPPLRRHSRPLVTSSSEITSPHREEQSSSRPVLPVAPLSWTTGRTLHSARRR